MAAILLAGVGLAAVLVWAGVIERQPTPAPVTSGLVTRTASEPVTFEWVDVASWASSGDDESPPFRISAATWRVVWVAPHDSVGDGSFAVDVYNSDGTYFLELYDTADSPKFDFGGPLSGTLGIDGRGEYFLGFRTARSYEITVQELR